MHNQWYHHQHYYKHTAATKETEAVVATFHPGQEALEPTRYHFSNDVLGEYSRKLYSLHNHLHTRKLYVHY
jgi:hypothetical protein